MSIKEQKLEILSILVNTRDISLLKEVKRLIEKSEKKAENISTAKLASIRRGLKQIEKGETIPHVEVKKLYEKWL